MNTLRILLVSGSATLVAAAALAQESRTAETAEPPPASADSAAPTGGEDALDAELRAYMGEVHEWIQKGKFKEYRARLHEAANKAVEERKKKLKRDDHPLSFWAHIKEWKLQTVEVTSVAPGPRQTAVVGVREDRFLIEEKGVDEGKEAEWLLVRNAAGKKPAWLILDRRNGGNNFSAQSIEKGFGDVLPAESGPVAAGGTLTPLAAYTAKVEEALRAKFKVPDDIPDNQRKNMKAVVRIMIDDNGTVQSRVVTRNSGHPEFDRAVIRAVDAAQPFAAPDASVEDAARKGIDITLKARP